MVPDEFFDYLAPRLNNAELKVVIYIIRRTFGFKKWYDNISLSQMVDGIVKKNGERLDHGTGLKKSAVCDALSSLEKKKVIIRKKQYDAAGGAIATSYQLHMHGQFHTQQEGTPVRVSGQGVVHPSPHFRTGAVHDSARPLSASADTQYTVNNKQGDNNVNVTNKTRTRSPLHKLDDAIKETDHIKLIVADILETLGDAHSKKFYLLVARKIPEHYIRGALSELKQSTVRSKARVFTSMMLDYVEYGVNRKLEQQYDELKSGRDQIARRFKSSQ
ncbi:MAG: replication protein [Candidatus Thiodiazotropha sp. (ex Lucinoma borealis)]|nr:replication protein [Candidatus Thiodiazotropha sp. (ex Lucinoma borealis)]